MYIPNVIAKHLMFSWLSDYWWKNIMLWKKNKNTLTSVCGLGLEKVMLSDGAPSHYFLEQKQKMTTTVGAVQRVLRCTKLQNCTQAGEGCLILPEGEK